MPDVTRALTSPSGLREFPRIDRYFPHCKVAALEAIARFGFGVADFSKCYGRHSFVYERPAGLIGFRRNGVELDLELHRASVSEHELEASIEDFYGLSVEAHSFTQLPDFLRFCDERLTQGEPLVVNFNLKFIRQRREYQLVSNPHSVIFTRCASGAYAAAEQMIGAVTLDIGDVEACFEHNLQSYGYQEVWQLARHDRVERSLSLVDVRQRVQSNLEILDSTEKGRGLLGLAQFADDIAEYVAKGLSLPFSVPGLWVFSHERHVVRRWLQHVARLVPSERQLFEDFDAVLATSFKHWLAVDYLLEKCLVSKNAASLKSLPSYFKLLLEDERAAGELWRRLARAL